MVALGRDFIGGIFFIKALLSCFCLLNLAQLLMGLLNNMLQCSLFLFKVLAMVLFELALDFFLSLRVLALDLLVDLLSFGASFLENLSLLLNLSLSELLGF